MRSDEDLASGTETGLGYSIAYPFLREGADCRGSTREGWWEKGRQLFTARPWPVPARNPWDGSRFSCYRIEVGLSADGCRRMAGFILSDREFDTWSRFRTLPQRRQQWVLGRLCAKEAVREILAWQAGLFPNLSEIEILPDHGGRPVAICRPSGYHMKGMPWVSISHSGDVVVAMAGPRDASCGVGIDVEPADRDCLHLERFALRQRERRLLRERAVAMGPEWSLRLWCAKEALAKATGLGMMGGPHAFVVEDMERNSGEVRLHLEGRPLDRCPEYRSRSFSVFTGRDSEVIFATAFLG